MGKKDGYFYWEWGRNSATRDGQKRPCPLIKLKKKNKRWTPLTKLSGSAHAEHSITKFHIVLSFQSAYLPEKISELPPICITNFGKGMLCSISRRHVANFGSQKNIKVSRMNSIK